MFRKMQDPWALTYSAKKTKDGKNSGIKVISSPESFLSFLRFPSSLVRGEDHEVVGQRLTFPFPFVHQQPHDCGNKTINRWETSLWNLSYNLSAVNILHNLLLFPSFPSIMI